MAYSSLAGLGKSRRSTTRDLPRRWRQLPTHTVFLLFSAQESSVELIGMALFTIVAGAFAIGLAILAMRFRRSRPYALAILVTPPIAVILLFLCGWSILDSGTVCGPDPEWDRCPTTLARILGWSIWVASTMVTAYGAFWAQKVLKAAISLWFDSPLMSIFHPRPRWGRSAPDSSRLDPRN